MRSDFVAACRAARETTAVPELRLDAVRRGAARQDSERLVAGTSRFVSVGRAAVVAALMAVSSIVAAAAPAAGHTS